MKTTLSNDDLELHVAFGIILSIESLRDYIIDIAELIYNSELNRENIQKILDEHKIKKIDDIKEDLLDLLIVYINLILNDHIISTNEKYNVELLKKYFKIQEGDFYKYRYQEVEDILHRQFERIYLDNNVSKEEAIHHVDLQDLFNLGYDQFEEFKSNEIRRALDHGANIFDLDTARYPNEFSLNNEVAGRNISKQVMIDVWNRDGRKCVKCGSQDRLEFDHIIPFAKGGSNTFRNIQLLCESCNRKKSDLIG
jgi:hypothetical protein